MLSEMEKFVEQPEYCKNKEIKKSQVEGKFFHFFGGCCFSLNILASILSSGS